MIKFEEITFPAASLGEDNPMPDIKNISYIHAGYEMTPAVSEEESQYIGHGMISTMLPYLQQDGYDRDKKPRGFKAAVLENAHLRAVFLPELGGRLWSLYDKDEERELLYVNPVFQPGNLALRNAWFSGGVEFNVGIKGHNPLTCSPLWCAVDQTAQGEILRLYEYERIRGVVYSVSAWLPEDSAVLYLRCRIENCTDEQKHMYWWSNIAVPETKKTRILVPARDSFLCSYQADHYVLDKANIPEHDGIDVSYPVNIPSSRDFFYKIPKSASKWIASADEKGEGLLQCSNNQLYGRKLFVWGQGQGGRNWNEWLSKEGSAYIEIQAGLAHTQLEHIPMPARTTWEWTECYTALKGDCAVLHGDYERAVNTVEHYLKERVGETADLSFPSDDTVTESRIVYRGSGWGAVEELVRGEKISASYAFPLIEDAETAAWRKLLETESFPVPDPDLAPESYVTGKFWLERLEALEEQSWFSLLHIGVIRYAGGDVDGAKAAWEASAQTCENAWALRNLSMLYKNEYHDIAKAREYILCAFEQKQDCRSLCVEVAAQLTTDGGDELWLKVYDRLSDSLKKQGRLRLYRAVALIHLKRLEEAAEIINMDFEMSDIKEGELSVSQLWFELYRQIYAAENGMAYDPENEELCREADEKYPLPKKLDFRMH